MTVSAVPEITVTRSMPMSFLETIRALQLLTATCQAEVFLNGIGSFAPRTPKARHIS
jgi:hypothetical protein